MNEFSGLSDSQKEALCRSLLAEFGVTKITAGANGELIHSCALPWHDDKHPSASLNYLKLVVNCFSCCSSGSLLWWIASCRGTSTHQARQWMEGEIGDDGENLGALLAFFDTVYNPKLSDKEPVPKYSLKILDQWRWRHPYLAEIRGVCEETQDFFTIGYDPKAQRITIPIFWRGHLVGWQTRRLANDSTPKYMSSPSLPRRSILYNYDPRREAIVFESPFSVLIRWQHCPVVEATLGASVTDRQIRLLAAHPSVILFFDNDESGWKATENVGAALLAYTPVKVVENPYAADPGDLDNDTFGQLIADAVPFEVWERPKELSPWP